MHSMTATSLKQAWPIPPTPSAPPATTQAHEFEFRQARTGSIPQITHDFRHHIEAMDSHYSSARLNTSTIQASLRGADQMWHSSIFRFRKSELHGQILASLTQCAIGLAIMRTEGRSDLSLPPSKSVLFYGGSSPLNVGGVSETPPTETPLSPETEISTKIPQDLPWIPIWHQRHNTLAPAFLRDLPGAIRISRTKRRRTPGAHHTTHAPLRAPCAPTPSHGT